MEILSHYYEQLIAKAQTEAKVEVLKETVKFLENEIEVHDKKTELKNPTGSELDYALGVKTGLCKQLNLTKHLLQSYESLIIKYFSEKIEKKGGK